jgi:MFS family permease
LALAGALVLVALTGSFFWSAVAFAIIGVAVAFVYSGSLFYSIEGTQASTHKAGWHEGIIGLGVACGLMLTGHMPWLLSLVGVADRPWQMRSPYVLTAALVLVGVLVQLAVYFRRAP